MGVTGGCVYVYSGVGENPAQKEVIVDNIDCGYDETDEFGTCAPAPMEQVEETEETGPFWACAEVYQASRRPSRMWVQSGNQSPNAEDENGEVAYPFNGMGGVVIDGPFDTKFEAEMALDEAIYIDDGGYTRWA